MRIIDVHTHIWHERDHFSEGFRIQAARARTGVELDLSVDYDDYRRQAPHDTITIVFGGKARLSGLWVDDHDVAQYAARYPETLIGFLSLDPAQEGWEREMRQGHRELGLRGIKLLPMYAGFRPDDDALEPLWEYAQRHNLPVILHAGTTFVSQAPLACTFPRWLDPVAIRFPELRIVLAHLAHPYEHECVAIIRKHEHVYADISALHYRPYQLYQSLMLVQEYGVWDKLLFGTDYPFTTVNASLDGLRRLNRMLDGTALPRLDAQRIEAVIYRDSLGILGL
jgi:predicted TIM-barrel fold metal-dependent hydrolase